MIICGEQLALYWRNPKRGICGCFEIFKEIEKGEYVYNLEPSQTVYAIRYNGTNLECYFDCKILEVSEQGVMITSWSTKNENKFLPWNKDFHCPAYSKDLTSCSLKIEPCDELFEKNTLSDILSGQIVREDARNGKGIWYQHGGWRSSSSYEINLKNFVKIEKPKKTRRSKKESSLESEQQNMFVILKTLCK